MKKRALKTAIIAIEAIAIAIAVAAAALIFLYWRLGQGPAPLGLFRPSVEFAIEQRLPAGFDAKVGPIELRRTDEPGIYELRVEDVVANDAEGAMAAQAPEILLSFGLGDLLAGKVGPRTVAIDGAEFRIVRNENLNIEIPIATAKERSKKSARPRLSGLINGRLLKSAFDSAIVSDATITFIDKASARSWSAPDSYVELRRTEEGLSALIRGELEMGAARAALNATAAYSKDSRIVDVDASGENFPVGDLLSTFYGDDAAIVDAPVSGRAQIAFTVDGQVLSSKIAANLGEGTLSIGGDRRTLSHVNWSTEFDPNSNRFAIDKLEFDFDGASGALAGDVSISFGEDIRKPESITFELHADEILLDARNQLPADLPVRDVTLGGRYIVPERRLTVDDAKAAFAGLTATGNLSLVRQRAPAGGRPPSPGVIVDIDLEGSLGPERLLSIWPHRLATGARDWVSERLAAAEISNLDFAMNLPPGAIAADGAVPDEAMSLTFDARNVTAHYVPGMTPITNASGSGVLRGNSFTLKVDAAKIGDVRVTAGEVSFPEFVPKWQPTYYRFTALGKSQSILAVLDEAPLSLLSKVGLTAENFSGDARAVVEIMRPNKREVAPEDYGYSGKATFENLTLSNLVGDLEITDAKGTVDLKTRSLKVEAAAALASEAPINMIWRQNFYAEDGPSDISISGVFNSSAGDLFGMSTRRFLRGPVAFEAKATGALGEFETLNVNANFDEATITVDPLGWRKPSGSKAAGNIAMTFAGDEVRVDALSLSGEGVDIAGTLSFDKVGVLQSAALRRFYLDGGAELSIMADRDDAGVLGLTAVGPFLNAGPMIEQMLEGQDDGAETSSFNWGAGLAVQARIDQIAMRNGIEYSDGAFDLRRDAERLQALDFTAIGDDGRPLTAAMALTGASDGPQRSIVARTSSIGEMMNGVFGVDSVAGGEGSVRILLHQQGEPGFGGELEARNLQIMNAPLLARIFSAGSLDGLANLMNGEGIAFDYAYGQFDYADGVVEVKDMRATGTSVGITADGYVAIAADGVSDLSGAVAPIYAINSVLGNAPIIGDILVGKKGEGLLAFTYRVTGETSDPTVFVNPLSALTPGIFRTLMQPPRATAPEADPESEAPALELQESDADAEVGDNRLAE